MAKAPTPTLAPPAALNVNAMPKLTSSATAVQLAAIAKIRIVALAAHRDTVQAHIDALEADLATQDPADIQAAPVAGYPTKPIPGRSSLWKQHQSRGSTNSARSSTNSRTG